MIFFKQTNDQITFKKMKKLSRQKANTLLIVGMLVVTVSQGFSQFGELPDLVKGAFTGVGIGLLITALIFGNFKPIS